MCHFIQREYSCGHFRFIASNWCVTYATTHKRCQPTVSHYEYVEPLCGDCNYKNQPPVPWEYLIRRNNKRTSKLV